MKELAKSVAGIVNKFKKPKVGDLPIDLDAMAKEGRKRLWLTEQGVREASPLFHASQLADPCMRFDVVQRIVLNESLLLGYGVMEKMPVDEQKFDFALQRKFDVGHAFHGMEQHKYFGPLRETLIGRWRCSNCHFETDIRAKMLRPPACNRHIKVMSGKKHAETRKCSDLGEWVYMEPKIFGSVAGKEQITGSIDLPMFVAEAKGKAIIVDIKTVGSDKWDDLMGPSDKDVLQLKIYLWCWPCEVGILRYINMGDANQTKHWVVHRDPVLEDYIRDYINTVNTLVEEGRWQAAGLACAKPTVARAKRCPLSKILCFTEE